jgi:hypothetical protein
MKRSLARAAISLLGVMVLAGVAATSESAGEVRGLVFRDNRSLSLSWAETQAGASPTLCNVGRTEAVSVQASLTGFSFKQKSSPLEDTNALAAAGVPATLPAGECVPARVKANPGVTVDAGTYPGILVATSAGAGVARLLVTITGPEAVPKPATIAGALDTAELRATRNGPWGDTTLKDGGKLPLKPPKAGEELALGEDCVMPKKGKPDEAKCPFLGNLYNGTHAAHVYVNGKPEASKGAVLLPLRIEGADKVGDYQGSLDLAQTGNAQGNVKVKLMVTDALLWAVLAVLLGAALPTYLQLRSGRWRPERKLHERRCDLTNKYTDGEAAFHRNAPDFSDLHRPTDAAITTYSNGVDKAIRAYAKSVLVFDMASEPYKKIEDSLALAEKDAAFLGSERGLAKSLNALKSELQSLENFLRDHYPVGRAPRLAREAASVLKGGNLEVGEGTKRASTAYGYVAVLKQWRRMAERVLRDELWARLLAQHAVSDADFSEDDKKLLAQVAAKLVEVRMELLDASSASDIEQLGTSRDLDTAYQGLADLGSRHGVWVPPAEANLAAIDVDWQALDLRESVLAEIDLVGVIDSVGEWIEQSEDLIVRAAESVDIRRTLRWLADVGALIVAIVVGVVAGLSTFYFGETFGTTEDYLTVILVGAASQVLVKGILDRAAVLWQADADPQVAQDLLPAAVKPADAAIAAA